MNDNYSSIEHGIAASLHEAIAGDPALHARLLRIARLAARAADAPIGYISLLGEHEQWIAAAYGAALADGPRSESICTHTIESGSACAISNLTADARFATLPQVKGAPNMRSYAAVPLRVIGGHRAGMVCVADRVARSFAPEVSEALFDLSEMARDVLEQHRSRVVQNLHAIGTEGAEGLPVVAESVVDVISRFRADLTVLYTSPAVFGLLGFTPAELQGRSVPDLVHPDDRPRLLDAARTVMTNGSARLRARLRRKDESYVWVEATAGALLLARTGEISEVHVVTRDISQQVAAEEEATRLRERYQSLVEQSADPIFVVERSGEIVEVNEAALTLTGFSRETLLMMNAADLVGSAGGSLPLLAGQMIPGKPRRANSEVLCSDGHVVPVESAMSLLSSGLVQVIARDISVRLAAEEALKESEQFLRATLDSLSAHLAVLDEDGRIIAVNALWNRFGIANGGQADYEWAGADYLAACDQAAAMGEQYAVEAAQGIRSVLAGERETFVLEYPCNSAQDDRWFLMRVNRFRERDPYRVVVAHEDITERQHAALARREASRRLGMALDAAQMGVWEYRPASGMLRWLEQGRLLASLKEKGMHPDASGYFEQLAEEDREPLQKAVDTALSTGGALDMKVRLCGNDGPDVWLHACGEVVQDPLSPGKSRLLGTVTDITARKELEDAAELSAARYQSLSEQSIAGVYIVDKGRFTYVNTRFAEIFGYSVEEILALGFLTEIILEEDRPLLTSNIERRLSGEIESAKYIIRGIKKDGSLLYTEVHGRRYDPGTGPLIMGVLFDVTQRVESERALAEREALLKAAAKVAQTLTTLSDLEAAVQSALAMIGEATRADRVYIFESGTPEAGRQLHKRRYDWHRRGPAENACEDPLDGQSLSGLFGGHAADLMEGKAIATHVSALPVHLRPQFERQSVLSMLIVPVIVGEEWLGFVGLDDCTAERAWSSAERSVLTMVATTLGGVLKRRRMEEERERNEAALSRSELRFRSLVESTAMVVWRADAKGLVTELGDAWARFTGQDPDEVSGWGWLRALHPEDAEKTAAVWKRQIEEHFPWDSAYRVRRADGVYEWFSFRSAPVFDADGTFVEWVGTCSNIDEKMRADAALHESEQRMRLMLESIRDYAIYTISVGGDVMSWSAGGEALFGYTAEEIIGRPADVFYTAEDREAGLPKHLLDLAAAEGRAEAEGWRVDRSGRHFWAQSVISAIHDASGRVRGFAKVVRDMTERREQEEKLRLLHAAMENATDAIMIVEAPGRFEDRYIVYVNAAFERAVGYTADELIGLKPTHLFEPDTSPETLLNVKLHLQEGFGYQCEMVATSKDGSATVHDCSISPVIGEDGHPTHFVAIHRDATKRKRTEHDLIEAKELAEEMNRLKSSFLANMSHEIRTPLTSIIGFSEVLKEEFSGVGGEFVEMIHAGGVRLLETLNSVLDLAQLESGTMKFAPVCLHLKEEADGILPLFQVHAARKGLTLAVEADEDVKVDQDRVAVGRVLQNLISNAVKFTDRGGVTVRVGRRGDRAMLEVRDTGRGMTEAFLPHLFDEFRQESTGAARTHEGSGLGLAITKRLIELMEGTIEVESTQGEGSVFRVTWPAADAGRRPSQEALVSSREEPATRLPEILIVEDAPEVQLLFSHMLRDRYRAVVVSAGEDALRLIREKPFEVIMMDINLSGSLSGASLLKLARSESLNRRTPIIACTAHGLPGDAERFIAMGFDGYLPKPFRRTQLFEVLDNAMPAGAAA